MPNFSTSLFDTTASLEVSNRFETLSSLSEPDSPVPDNIGPPKAASSPIVQQSKEAKPKTNKAVLNHPLRILIMNCQSVKNKKSELHTIIDSAKPDIILGNESWLTPDIKNSKIFPDSFDAIRKDRVGDAHGGVFIAFRRDLLCTEDPELDTECEIVWCKLNIIGCRTLYLGSFYRPPNRKPEIEKAYLEAFNQSLTRIMTNKNAHVLVGGDFNCGNIEWSTMQVPEGVPNRRVQSQLLDIAQDHCLSQVVNIHTREDKTLDLLLTNSPSPVNRVKGMPPIGKADHDIVYVEYDIKAKRIQQAPRKIFLYNRADMDGLRDHLARFRDTFLSSDHSHMSVSFKSEVIAAIERFIPTKMTKTKYSLPWIDSSIRRLIRKREKLYFCARKSSSPDVKNHYKRFRAHVQKRSSEMHIGNIFPIYSLLRRKALIPTALEKMKRQKSFGHL